jgi:MOSC domain-containing protein YiiM
MKHHGGPDRALCLYSLEHIEALQGEGHPIYPGSTGENLTVSGAVWSSMIPGATFDIGSARIMITSFTKPCQTIRESFDGHHISRISEKVHPGWSRVYAKVLHQGGVKVGDTLTPVRS